MLEIKNLKKIFGTKTAVDISELKIEKGETIGLVGNNGAGKTTLFRLMLDLYQATEGEVLSKGANVANSEDWKNYTGAFVDNGFLIDFLTPEEYFEFVGNVRGLSKEETFEKIEMFHKFFSNEILNQKKYIRNFSSGNKQKVGITGAMFCQPEIVILDEPFNFLDPSSQIEIKNLIQHFNENFNTTIIISSHNLDHIVDVSSRIILMENGKIIQDINNNNNEASQILNDYFKTN
ncbi:MAG: ABC transporter ATP-binding protein [Bacteroidales bacterium]|nr:ABC transporter ATP-binding protein [Bacteroidales bacterium]